MNFRIGDARDAPIHRFNSSLQVGPTVTLQCKLADTSDSQPSSMQSEATPPIVPAVKLSSTSPVVA